MSRSAKAKRKAKLREYRRSLAGAVPSAFALAKAADYQLGFGKYEGRTLAQVNDVEPGYVSDFLAGLKGEVGRMAGAYVGAIRKNG